MASFLRRLAKALGLLPTRGPLVHAIPVFSFSPRRGTREVLVAYRENGWLRAVVDTVADAVATPQWKAYKRVAAKGEALGRPALEVAQQARAPQGAEGGNPDGGTGRASPA